MGLMTRNVLEIIIVPAKSTNQSLVSAPIKICWLTIRGSFQFTSLLMLCTGRGKRSYAAHGTLSWKKNSDERRKYCSVSALSRDNCRPRKISSVGYYVPGEGHGDVLVTDQTISIIPEVVLGVHAKMGSYK